MTEKICNKCKELKPLSEYSFHSASNYKRPECKSCNNKLSRDRKALKKISPPIPADHKCPICEKQEEELKGRGGQNRPAFVLDHNHDSVNFRGYLCHSCNRGLGTFHSVSLLASAIKYLEATEIN